MDDNGLRTGAAECTVCRKNTTAGGGLERPLRGFTWAATSHSNLSFPFRENFSPFKQHSGLFVFALSLFIISPFIHPDRSRGKKSAKSPPPLPPIVVVTPTELLMNYFFGPELEPFRPKLVRKRAACPFRAWQMFDGVTTWPLARCATSWKTVFAYDRSILPPPSVPAPPFSTSFPLFFPLLSLSRVFFTSSRLVKRRLNSISSYLLTYSLLCVANNGFHRLSNDDCWLASSLPTS